MKLYFFGSSLVSAYWNGAATYYRGMCKYLHALGHEIVFVEQDIYERQRRRDLATDPDYATVRVLDVSNGLEQLDAQLDRAAAEADWIFVCSGTGANDDYIQRRTLDGRRDDGRVAFWDVDAPFNLTEARSHPDSQFTTQIPRWDYIFTYGGGPRVVEEYKRLGAKYVAPIYNAVDPDDYFPVAPDESPEYTCDLLLMANRMPDREARIYELFVPAAELAPDKRFVLGGEGWAEAPLPPNVHWIGHVPTADHARRNCSARMVLNINRTAMADYGYSPPTRIFEAAGNAACVLTDHWIGIDHFFQPGAEILVAASAQEITNYLNTISREEARAIGERAHQRVLRDHTYRQRALEADRILRNA